ncbi:MAG: LysM peptidoglycan-binding domain-containing protein [Chitinophagaceae bacterium]|nr:LysM peptidoglycan-binding domain-containing protein [Chitinophagaceae bacterium]MBL0055997.1 LysM peptidoglycan-binding domain-containing protein [Chitinophagaceae bacterium]
MKRYLFLLLSLPLVSLAQNKMLLAEGSSPGLYLTHTVAPKENFYSIGRLYNISPKEIAPFNKLALEKGLSLGQVLKIPLTSGNFMQEGSPGADEALIPVYHTVKEKEGLYRISMNYNKVPVDKLKQWNRISGDGLSNGANLIVGYLRVKKDQSALAASQAVQAVAVDQQPVAKIEQAPVIKETELKKAEPVKEVVTPVVKEPVPEVKKQEPVSEVITPVVKEKKEEAVKPVINNERPPVDFNGGLFKPTFDAQTKGGALQQQDGMAGVFKSTSGWQDGKYYCLHNALSPGTIIRITNGATGKSVYAKVLDVIPDIKQNDGLLIRISNAAASELGAGETNFNCSIHYSK